MLNGNCDFVTCDGIQHRIDGEWDLIIAHPPCTRLCNSGQRWLYYGDALYQEKKERERQEGIDFFMKFTDINCNHVAIENPIGIMSNLYRKPDCIYNPYDFKGETECKQTCLWLKNLPPLKPTQTLSKELRTHGIWKAQFNGKYLRYNDPEVARLRSKTPIGVAKAMASQWSEYIERSDFNRNSRETEQTN